MNELYPPKEWIQRLLDRGAVIDDSTDFQTYFWLRNKVFKYRSRDLDLESWQSNTREIFDLPEDAPWIDVENAIIDKRIRTWLEEERELRSKP